MNQTGEGFELSGAVRLSPKSDSLGIAVFSLRQSNHVFVAETDDSLRIDDFIQADVTPVSLTTNSLIEAPRFYNVGDAVPIPVWKSGEQSIILSDRPWQTLVTDSKVTERLSKTLRKAQGAKSDHETGSFHDRFQTFLMERPTSDRYWVTRYRDVLAQAAGLPLFEDRALEQKLAELGKTWASECASKAQPNTLRLFVESLQSSKLEEREFSTAQALALLYHVSSRPASARTFSRYFDNLESKEGVSNILEYLASTQDGQTNRFQESVERLTRSLRTALIHAKWRDVESLTHIFGETKRLPHQVQEIAHQVLSFKASELSNLAEKIFGSDAGIYSIYLRQAMAAQAIDTAKAIQAIRNLIYPEDRLSDPFAGHFSSVLDRTLINELKEIADGVSQPKWRNR